MEIGLAWNGEHSFTDGLGESYTVVLFDGYKLNLSSVEDNTETILHYELVK